MKILILTCKFGMGHYSAAKSIEKKLIDHYDNVRIGSLNLQDYYEPGPKKLIKDFWRELKNIKIQWDDIDYGQPEEMIGAWSEAVEEVKIVDLFELAYPEYINLVYRFYGSVIDKGAKLANFIYKRSDEVTPSENRSLELIYNHVLGSATKLLFKEKPDIIISAFSLCSEVVSDYKRLSSSDVPLITAITDIYPHATWVNEYTDHYLVAVEETKEILMRDGVPADRIHVVGMPIGPQFECLKYEKQRNDPQENGSSASDALCLNPRKRKLLIMGGGLGLVPMSMDFYKELDSRLGMETTVVTGKNHALYRKLYGRFEHVRVLGFVDNIRELMLESDLLLSKSGGITTFEAMYADLPMAIFKPFLQQEISNAEFVQKNELGIVLSSKMRKAENDVEEIVNLLFDEERLRRMGENIRKIVQNIRENEILHIIDKIQKDLANEYRAKGVRSNLRAVKE